MSSLSQDQVRLVLRRAAELERTREAAPPEAVAERELSEMAQEIGIAPEAVRQALIELRSGALPAEQTAERSLLDRLVGPADLVVTRSVRGPAAQVQLAVADFLRTQALEIRRNLGERGQIWSPAKDLWSKMKRAFDLSDRLVFQEGTEVVVTVTPQADDQVLVRFTAHFARPRKSRAWGLAAGVAAGIGIGATGVALLGPAALDAAAVGAGLATAGGTYFGVRASHKKDLSRAEEALLLFLDRLEYER